VNTCPACNAGIPAFKANLVTVELWFVSPRSGGAVFYKKAIMLMKEKNND